MSVRDWIATYRTPFALGVVFVALIGVFAITPDPDLQGAAPEQTTEPTAGPGECVVCPIDQECDPRSGQCRFIDHTPWPCVKGAEYDDAAGQCLPTGAPPAPPPVTATTGPGRIPGPDFPPGIGGDGRGPDLPAIGD
jgi:hypothetical protein